MANRGYFIKVDRGYIFEYSPRKAGTYTISIREKSSGVYQDTGASITLKFVDYKKEYDKWLDNIISKNTGSSNTPEENFMNIVKNAFADWKYVEVVEVNGREGVISLLGDSGTIWERKRMHSLTAPALLEDIGERIDYPVEWAGADNHASVYMHDGSLVTICPMSDTGLIDNIMYIDFSSYAHSYGKGKMQEKADCDKAGLIVYPCTDCTATKGQAIAAPKELKLSKTLYEYDGKVKTPKVTVIDVAGNVVPSKNYRVMYASGRKKVGIYKVTVRFKGFRYTGTLSSNFKIR